VNLLTCATDPHLIFISAANLLTCATGPHLIFIALRDKGLPAVYGLGTPDQGAGQGPSWPLGQMVEINSNKAFQPDEVRSPVVFMTRTV
jgi:hypothetical protein